MNSKEQQILDAAEYTFSIHGFHAGSMREIANIAGVNPAMLHYYFGSKENLLSAVLQRRIAGFQVAGRQLTSERLTTLQKLMGIVELNIRLISENTSFFRFVLQEQLICRSDEANGILRDYVSNGFNLIRDILTEGVAEGELGTLDINLTCLAIYGTYVSCLLNQDLIADHSEPKLQERLRVFFEQYFTNLLSQKK